VLQELITNTLKHAAATEIHISIKNEGDIFEIEYQDNGHGFDEKTNTDGLGLQNIKTRLLMINAGFEMNSITGKGFQCSIRLPHTQIGNN
jgi:two-component system, NarL family, sensor histidine kinase DegS